jgi:hypothetical protein
MKLSRTDEFFARALILKARMQGQGSFGVPLRGLQAPVTDKERGNSPGMVFDCIQPLKRLDWKTGTAS